MVLLWLGLRLLFRQIWSDPLALAVTYNEPWFKSVVAWRKEFGIEELLEEEFENELEKVVFMHGVDKEGRPVCYNAFGEFSNKELYHNTFSDEEKRTKFLRWRIQFLEKSIRKLDFSPDGVSTIVQVNDLKNSPGFFAKEHRQATNQALQLLQDNYPEFVAKQGATEARLHKVKELGNTTVGQLDSYSTHEQKSIYGASDNKIRDNMDFVSLKSDADVKRHGDMVQVSLLSGSLGLKYCYAD